MSAPYVSLRGKSSFAHVYRSGQRLRSGGVTMIGAEGRPGPSAVGVVAGKRVGTAVERNRAKRRLRAALREVDVPDGTAWIVVASRQVGEVAFERLVAWLKAGIEQIGHGPLEDS